MTSPARRAPPIDAAVVILDDWLPDDVLQAIAAENNHSEAACESSCRRATGKTRTPFLQRDLR